MLKEFLCTSVQDFRLCPSCCYCTAAPQKILSPAILPFQLVGKSSWDFVLFCLFCLACNSRYARGGSRYRGGDFPTRSSSWDWPTQLWSGSGVVPWFDQVGPPLEPALWLCALPVIRLVALRNHCCREPQANICLSSEPQIH